MKKKAISKLEGDNKTNSEFNVPNKRIHDLKSGTENTMSQILCEPQKNQEENDEADFGNNGENFIKLAEILFSEDIDFFMELIEPFLKKPLTLPQKNIIKNIFIQKMIGCKARNDESLSILTEFLINENRKIKFSFEEIKRLISLNINKEQLKNLMRLKDEILLFDIMDIENLDILSDDIVDKAIKLQKIVTKCEDEIDYIDYFGMDLSINNFIYLRNINLSEELIEKIKKLLYIGVDFSIKDLELINNIEINPELEKKIKKLKNKVSINGESLTIVQNTDINEGLLKKIRLLRSVGILLFGTDIPKLRETNITQEDIKKLKYIIKRLKGNDFYFDEVDFILKLGYKDIDKIFSDAKKMGVESSCFRDLKILHGIPNEVLQYCDENGINNTGDIEKVKSLYLVSSKEYMKDYIKRKEKYLEKNRTLSEEKYIEYFGSKGKFGKHEIYQGNIGLCYLYSGLEILKKMNGFEVLIQSNLVEKKDGWLVRIPLNTGSRIKVNKTDIDKTYEITNIQGGTRKMNINSKSEYLGFKILEIAYIKMKLINNKTGNKSGDGKEDNPLDINIDGAMLTSVEGGDTIKAMEDIFSNDCIILGEIWSGGNHNSLKILEKKNAPDCVLDRQKRLVQNSDARINKLFDLFGLGFISIEARIDPNYINSGEGIEEEENTNRTFVSVDNVKIVNKSGQEISKDELNDLHDIIQDGTGKTKVLFFSKHAYSIEKCYIDESGQKRLRIVNPWHTDTKFDLSLDQCKDLFNFTFGVINIDKLFR